jgi:hypothetical protein
MNYFLSVKKVYFKGPRTMAHAVISATQQAEIRRIIV